MDQDINPIIKIPLKSYLKKYITKRLSIKDNEFELNMNDSLAFGQYLIEIINKKRQYYLNSTNDEMLKFFNSLDKDIYLNVYIKPRYSQRCGVFLNDEKIFLINKFIDKQFRNEMLIFNYSNQLYSARFILKYGINDFLSIYGITENEISEETLTRHFYREKTEFVYVNSKK